jgi:glutamyl-tRNA(Gln) amidotransferase subunit E
MAQNFDPVKNYEESKQEIGYIPRNKATQADYDRIGFMSGLEVHQQLKTKKKLFCNCPAGFFQKGDDYDAELIRHMRPTLSELGEYDGTALMEFKTRKNIVYRIKNKTACTYEVDDTPPFPLNREALEYALEITILSKLKIVGEVHITRKQYLDGSIPTGFQRTAILGVEGMIQLKNKQVRLIQLSIEEDSCREVSDIGHWRIYRTDRLGMPLIETVTYPDFTNPDEVKEGADYIRFLNRSTNHVLTGIGSTRADVNVSCKGGTRVEIKGVAHTRWMPELTHNECFRQWSLLRIKGLLATKVKDQKTWKINSAEINPREFSVIYKPIVSAIESKYKIYAVNLPDFKGILSHFTQPGKMFANEITERLKVIACLEQPNMIHSEQFDKVITKEQFAGIRELLKAGENDAQVIFWGPEDDVKTALETIEERCKMAFEGVPNETRKAMYDGATTIFERVLPGADRMYPDTDSAPIPLADSYIKKLSASVPMDICERYEQLRQWNAPVDTYTYILKNNLMPLIERIHNDLGIAPKFICSVFGHTVKHIQGKHKKRGEFSYEKVYELFRFLKDKGIDVILIRKMLSELYEHPKMDFESVLVSIKFKPIPAEEIVNKLPYLEKKYKEIRTSADDTAGVRWVMGNLSRIAIGNIPLAELKSKISL